MVKSRSTAFCVVFSEWDEMGNGLLPQWTGSRGGNYELNMLIV